MKQNINRTIDRFFAPVNGSFLFMVLTFIYLFVFFQLYSFMAEYLENRFEIKEVFSSFFNLFYSLHNFFDFVIGPILLITLCLVITFSIHKKWWQGFLASFLFLIPLYIYVFTIPSSNPLEHSMALVATFFSIPIFLLGVVFASFLLRWIFRLRLWIKFLIMTVPFVIVFSIILVTAIQVNNFDVKYCLDFETHNNNRAGCFRNLAVIENDPSMCMKISWKGEPEGCLKQFNDPIHPSLCYTLEGREQYSCYLFIAQKFEDISICDYIKDSVLRHNCSKAVEKR